MGSLKIKTLWVCAANATELYVDFRSFTDALNFKEVNKCYLVDFLVMLDDNQFITPPSSLLADKYFRMIAEQYVIE